MRRQFRSRPWLAVALVIGLLPAFCFADVLSQPAVRAQGLVLLAGAQAGNRLIVVGERGQILLSDDHGKSWQRAAIEVDVTLTAVRMVDDRHGMAVGHGGVVLVTDDGGSSWQQRLDGRRAAQLALDAASSAHDEQASQEARRLVEEGPDKPFLDLLMLDRDRALVVGAYGLAFETSDGGRSWQPWMSRLDNPRGLHLYAVKQRGDTLVIAGEQGLLLYSEDRGAHFRRIETPYRGSFFTLELPGSGDILVAGLKGSLLRSGDAGQSWQRIDTGANASFTASSLGADGTLYLVNQAGQVLGWEDGKLARLDHDTLPALNGILPIDSDHVVLLSNLGVSTLRLGEAEGRLQ